MAKKLKIEKKVDLNIHVIGISSTLKDYRMAQIVNKALALDLVRLPGLPVFQEKSDTPSSHSLYLSDDVLNRRIFHLILNRSEGWMALPFNPPIDFVIIITGKVKSSEMKHWTTELRKGTGVMMVVDIKLDQAKGLEGLLNDIEMHLLDLRLKAKEKSKSS